jgi:hypothetical protein
MIVKLAYSGSRSLPLNDKATPATEPTSSPGGCEWPDWSMGPGVYPRSHQTQLVEPLIASERHHPLPKTSFL